ncbi:MAG: hypothetical protein WCA85_00800 [Paraburkholderia sp.]
MENAMNAYYVAARAIAACVVVGSISPIDVYAQTGAAATKQMQDTQRAAHKKARDAKSTTPDHAKKKSENASAPASGVQ